MNARISVRPALLAAGLLTVGAALAATTYTIQLNGQAIPGSAIVQNGRTYVSSDALKAAGFGVTVKGNVVMLTSTAGGANQVSAVAGCVNQTLFNGIWRLKVLDVKLEGEAYQVKVEVRNGTTQSLSLIGTGLPFDKNFNLQLEDGNVFPARSGAVDIRDRAFIQGSSYTTTLAFDTGAPAGKPVKLVVLFNPDDQYLKSSGLSYSVKDPSFRVDLTCTK
ncbi:hypothetical protein [Deinococcus sp.]|uniref:hypothetical protein n=1 Tax=Deinococcus sp. TaxID=47478 RepID=UPI002869A472|nr:hypothetical protein [Deinococcus sp.]